jgi:hypothetical protein
VVRKNGSFHSSKGWLEKLDEWMVMHNMNMLELPSADCEAKLPREFQENIGLEGLPTTASPLP